jgi:hypothetical protein
MDAALCVASHQLVFSLCRSVARFVLSARIYVCVRQKVLRIPRAKEVSRQVSRAYRQVRVPGVPLRPFASHGDNTPHSRKLHFRGNFCSA